MQKKQRWHLDEVGHHVQDMQEKKKAYKYHFNPDWVKEWPAIIAKTHKGVTDAFCRVCRCDFSVSSGESKTCSVTSLLVTCRCQSCHTAMRIRTVCSRWSTKSAQSGFGARHGRHPSFCEGEFACGFAAI